EERREADRVAEHARHDEVVLDQAHEEDTEPRAEREVPRHGEADADRERARRERADDRHDLDDPRRGPDEDPVGQPDRPERGGEGSATAIERGILRRSSASTPGRIAAAMMKPRKTSEMTTLSFQSASALATTATPTRVAMKARLAVSATPGIVTETPNGGTHG